MAPSKKVQIVFKICVLQKFGTNWYYMSCKTWMYGQLSLTLQFGITQTNLLPYWKLLKVLIVFMFRIRLEPVDLTLHGSSWCPTSLSKLATIKRTTNALQWRPMICLLSHWSCHGRLAVLDMKARDDPNQFSLLMETAKGAYCLEHLGFLALETLWNHITLHCMTVVTL